MKRNTRQIVSILLVFCMCMAMLPGVLPVANAVSPGYSVSSAYQSSSYYSALLKVELTGDQREDIINVALSQAGYAEGSYSGDYGGADDGSYSNYTEYNYWYHNNISSGMPVGGSSAPWCATFVSWCAEHADIPTSILKRSTAAGHSSYYFNVNFYSGSSTLASSSDNDSYFMGYNYSPKKGDLFFTRSWSHVGLVVSSDGTYVTTVEGNTNNDGSADGYGVFVRTRRIADLYFGAPEYEDNSVKDYITSSCTYYPAHCQITIDSDTPINSQPRSVSTEDNSVTIADAAAGQTYTATGLYLNGFGNYWYRVETDYGEPGYVYSGDATYAGQITSDITLTDYAAPSAHLNGSSFSISGTIASEYNQLDTAACYIYSGFDHSGEAVTGYSDSVSGNQYVLGNSTVDYNTKFGALENGNHTYEISATYTNYYATSNTTISSNTGTIRLLNAYFVVIPTTVDQSSCSHSYSTTTLKAATCTASGTAVKSCSNCGLISETTVAAAGHSYGGWTAVDATCTTDGSQTRTCVTCGNVDTQTIAADGHDYDMVPHAATCLEYEIYEYTCGNCGDNYKLNAGELASGWIDYLPEGLDSGLFNSKTQYRSSDYETRTSYETSLSGYTLKSSAWEQSGTTTVNYVDSWPSGFSTSNSLYTEYDNKSSKLSASETATAKTTVDSDAVVGYLYYHWCYTDSYYSKASSTGSYTTFHAYYSTSSPDNYTCDISDYSYCTAHSTCSNSEWFFVAEVYAQQSISYNKLFTYERWTDYTDWSDTAVTASDTRQVESRSVYQLKSASLGGHVWSNGTCSVCGSVCSHTYSNGACTVCGMAEPNRDYYLFGYINGVNYGCEEDYENMGIYKFQDGTLTVSFSSDSYVAVKTNNNTAWYMTNGWLGYEVTSAALYNSTTLGYSADKLYVPGGVEVTFTLVDNGDDTFTLSYAAQEKEMVIPTITPKYPSLSFEGEIFINVYYEIADMDDVVEMGLYTSADTVMDDNDVYVNGYRWDEGTQLYCVRTEGIPAKNLGDMIYFKVYAKLSDGTYVYSSVYGYSPKLYAEDRIANSTSTEMKSLCVAMLNYGAAAQTYFGYKTDSLMNDGIDQTLVTAYEPGMVSGLVGVSSSKVGSFARNSAGYTSCIPSVSFEGAFAINYYFTPALALDDTMTLYYWNLDDYTSASVLTAANATGSIVMTGDGVSYEAAVSGIAAKEIDQTIFVAGVYTSGGVSYATGVLPYSVGAYCVDRINNGSVTMQALAQATAVYGYYAKQYFADV